MMPVIPVACFRCMECDLPVPVNPHGKRETTRGFKIRLSRRSQSRAGIYRIADPTAQVNMHFPRLSEMGLSRRTRNTKTSRNILAERSADRDPVSL